jgi:hypothetical protein
VCTNTSGGGVDLTLNEAALDFDFKVGNKVKLLIEDQAVKEFSIIAKATAKIGATTGGVSLTSSLVGDVKCSISLPGLASPPLFVYGISFQLAAAPKIGFDIFSAFDGPNVSFTGPTGIVTAQSEVGIKYDTINNWSYIDTFNSDYKYDLISGAFDTNLSYAFSADIFAQVDLQLKAGLGVPPIGIAITDFTFLEFVAKETFDMTIESPFDFHESTYIGPIGGLTGNFTVTPKASLSGGALAELMKKLNINTSVNLTISPIVNYTKNHWHTPEPIIIGPDVIDINAPASFVVSTDNILNSGDFAIVQFDLPLTTTIGELGFLGDIRNGYGEFQWAAVAEEFGAFEIYPRVSIDSLSGILPYANAVEKQVTVIDSHPLLIDDVAIPDAELQTCIDSMSFGRTFVYELTFIQCNQDVSDLSGIEFFTELETLVLLGGQISNIQQVASLTKLKTLNFLNHEITDISAIAGLLQLESLSLARNNIENISPLARLQNLHTLDLDQNLISDYSALSAMTNLQYLYLNDNEITSFVPIPNSPNIESMYMRNNFLNSIQGIEQMPQLIGLYLSYNNINDLSGISTLTNLTQVYLDSNFITDISGISSLINTELLVLDHNEISDISPLSSMSNATLIYLNDNQLTDVSVLQPLSQLTSVRIQGNHNLIPCSQINSLSFIQFLTHDSYYDVDTNGVLNQPPDELCN